MSGVPFYADDWLTVYHGDCKVIMAEMEPESVHCVVTSPPYWGLRDYGSPGQLGLEPTPEEYVANLVAVFREVRRVLRADGTVWLNLGSSYSGSGKGGNPEGSPWSGFMGSAARERSAMPVAAGASGRSPSRRPDHAPAYGTDGTEPSGSKDLGSAYSDLCDECRAVLSSRTTDTLPPLPDDAPLLSQTGRDSEPPGFGLEPLAASPLDVQASTTPRSEPLPGDRCSHCGNCGACLSVLRSSSRDARECVRKSWLNYPTFKPKDMVPIPWMVAMALQADGWYLRSDIIWSKPNPMPESVTDRPTKSHEYIFLLAKSPRYWFDADAVREPALWPDGMNGRDPVKSPHGQGFAAGRSNGAAPLAGRNIRSVWTMATHPYPGAHFATFPESLPERCIKAGTSEKGVCPECGASWERMVERDGVEAAGSQRFTYRPDGSPVRGDWRYDPLRNGGDVDPRIQRVEGEPVAPRQTTGWRSSCVHTDQPVPALVLDPFAGSGTTGMVAQSLSRRAVLIDLSLDYLGQLMARNADIPLGLGA